MISSGGSFYHFNYLTMAKKLLHHDLDLTMMTIKHGQYIELDTKYLILFFLFVQGI